MQGSKSEIEIQSNNHPSNGKPMSIAEVENKVGAGSSCNKDLFRPLKLRTELSVELCFTL